MTQPAYAMQNGRLAVPAQEKLSPTEQILAYIIGGGIVLAVIALFLYGVGVASSNVALSILLIGLTLIVIGVGAWLYLLKPWKSFDDLKTPHYTGHDEAHDEHVSAATEAPPATPEAPPQPEPEPAAEAAAPAAAAAAPAGVSAEGQPPTPEPAAAEAEAAIPVAEAGAEPDDLTLIEGVGPKSAQALNASGVKTYRQMAAMTPEALEDAVKSQKVRLVGSTETWPMQAELAAAGDFDALEKLKGRIHGGYLHDDLTLIEGVGPKAQEVLYEAGFRTYAAIAQAAPDALKAVLDEAGLTLLTPDTWPEQAGLLAKNDHEALKALQEQLKGGRKE